MKRSIILVAFLAMAVFGVASHSPRRKPQTMSMQQRLESTESKMKQLIAGHDRTMARMKKVQDQLDQLIQAVRAFREKLK